MRCDRALGLPQEDCRFDGQGDNTCQAGERCAPSAPFVFESVEDLAMNPRSDGFTTGRYLGKRFGYAGDG